MRPALRSRGRGAGAEYVPGNSVREMGERMKGGAVSDERSPENDAILHAREVGEPSREAWRMMGRRNRTCWFRGSEMNYGRRTT